MIYFIRIVGNQLENVAAKEYSKLIWSAFMMKEQINLKINLLFHIEISISIQGVR